MHLPVRLLIADDHPFIRDALRLLLSGQPEVLVVGEAENGWQTIELVQGLLVDVVLMDIQMPELDGIQATRHLSKYFPQIKVLALTLHDEPYYIQDILAAGALGCMPKVINTKTLIQAIHTVADGQPFIYQC
ncbi:MAG: response regulator transcription factor [Cyclobacteriaceae bacterium]